MRLRLPIANLDLSDLQCKDDQWRSNGVGRMGKVQGAPSEGAIIFLLQ